MSDKLLTVSIAAYNVEKYLHTCLQPFANHEFDDTLEILIIDDGATDNTPEIAQKYESEYPNIFRYVHKSNGGWGSTVNTGIQIANGKYFKQLDGDDYFNPDTLPEILTFLRKTDADVIFTEYSVYRDGTGEILETSSSRIIPKKKELISNILKTGIDIPVEMHTLMVRTSVLQEHYDEVKLLEHCFYTDVEYWTKSIALSETCIYLPLVMYMYRVGREGQSVSITGVRKHYKEHNRVLENCIEYVEQLDIEDTKAQFLRNRLKDMAGNQYIFFLYLEITRETKQELLKFDRWLKTRYPAYYPNTWNRVKALNKTGFVLYPILAMYCQKKCNL